MRSWMDIPLIQSLLVKQKNANSIVLNGYSDNDIKFKNEKLIVDFTDAETGENITAFGGTSKRYRLMKKIY